MALVKDAKMNIMKASEATRQLPPQPTSTISKQLGDKWNALHPDIKARFTHDPDDGEHVFYRGVMEQVDCSRAGWLFAWLTRIIGNPLTPHRGSFVKMDVILHKRPDAEGVYWRRTYYYPEREAYTVTSVKRANAKGDMTECVGGGFGMKLHVYEEGGNLHFRSTRYFWGVGSIIIPLPHWLSPGETHVVHENIDRNTFRFTINMQHKWLGRTFYQTGIFKAIS